MKYNNYTVYKHIFPNGKIYIGITSTKVELRWNKGSGYRTQYICRAIQKYGWENIKHEILFENLTKEEAEQKEIELIAQYKSNQKEYGYNISNGGNSTKGYKFTKKQRENLSKAKFKPIYCIEDDISFNSYNELKEKNMIGCHKAASGSRNTYQGKHYIFVDEINEYQKGSIKLKPISKKNVICLETKKIYNSISEAAKDTNCAASSISSCCTNKLKSTNNLHWKYYTNEFDLNRCEKIILEKEKNKYLNKDTKKIRCVETGEIYDYIKKAMDYTGISHISECCCGKRKTAGGLHWEFV